MEQFIKKLENVQVMRERINNDNFDKTMEEIRIKNITNSNLLSISLYLGVEDALKVKNLTKHYVFWNDSISSQKDCERFLEGYINFSNCSKGNNSSFSTYRMGLRTKAIADAQEFISEYHQQIILEGQQESKQSSKKKMAKKSKVVGKRRNFCVTSLKAEEKPTLEEKLEEKDSIDN
ncbi:hypothetical protein ABK040_008072 [Willaertia magna]